LRTREIADCGLRIADCKIPGIAPDRLKSEQQTTSQQFNPQSAIPNPQSQELPHIVKSLSRSAAALLVFIVLNLCWRLIFLPVNQGAYTDGILQVDMFRQGVSYWPPLYALLTRLFSWIPALGLEGAGRLVSLISGVLILWPLLAIARRLFGLRAGVWAMAAWTATPLALQWSLQVMTDMPFACLWMGTLAALLAAAECYLPGLFPQQGAAAPLPDPRKGGQILFLASFLGAMATLTRYQGILLLPPLVLAAGFLMRISRTLPGRRGWLPLLTLLPWLAVPAWLAQGAGSITHHAQQIGARTGLGPGATLLNYWNLFEEFLLKSPYFVSYGIFGFFLYGLFRVQWATARLRWAGWLALYFGLAILAMQSVFQSNQARYLLPLVPLACLFAGHGLAAWERHNEGRPVRFWSLALPVLALGLGFSALVAVYQGNPFKDAKDAARFAGEYVEKKYGAAGSASAPAPRIFSNEVYNATQNLFCVKSSFWSGREVKYLGLEEPQPGDLIVISSYYCGVEGYKQLRASLVSQLGAKEISRPFARFALPLMTDIMQEPGTAQSPLAWIYRYQRQYFESAVLEVPGTPRPAGGVKPGDVPPPPMPMPVTSGPSQATIDKIQAMQKEIETLKPMLNNKGTTR
jgi:4-amino-4-deoxy-L-arabinose transferase-like glycosyltransferase